VRIRFDGGRPRAVIVDVDGTLCDVRTIRHLVEGGPGARRDFNAFHSLSIDCPAHVQVLDALKQLNASGVVTVIVSGREERWAFLTALWLRDHAVDYAEMFLRANGDARSDVEVKRGMGERILARFEPVLALDDRSELITVWHELGIPTRLVSSGGNLGLTINPPTALGTDRDGDEQLS